jgi:hypothetical protein
MLPCRFIFLVFPHWDLCIWGQVAGVFNLLYLSVEILSMFRQGWVVAGWRCSFSLLKWECSQIVLVWSRHQAQSPAPLRKEKSRCRNNHNW